MVLYYSNTIHCPVIIIAFTMREKVIELYNQGKMIREIAKEITMYLRDVCYILKKEGVNHGIAIDDDNKKSHSNNEKSTQDYKL